VTSEHSVQFTSGSPETVLDPLAPELAAALDAARSLPPDQRRAAVAAEPIDRYAFARVGYHRGLDALRAAGWRGSGYVRWRHEPNRGFLRSLHALQLAAGAIGETDEEQRCALFLRQLDPEWGSHEG